jgi:hypothetical protein
MKFNQKSHSMNRKPTGVSTFAIRTSQRTAQKLQNSVVAPAHGRKESTGIQ